MGWSNDFMKRFDEWLQSGNNYAPVVTTQGADDAASTGSNLPDGLNATEFVFEHLLWTSGNKSASGLNWDMNANGSIGTPSLFEYTVPAGRVFYLSRTNIEIIDGAITPPKFAGIAALTNGLLFHVVADDGATVLLDFNTDTVPVVSNADFAVLAGVDSIIANAAGDDFLPVRWTQSKAGAFVRMTAGQVFRVYVRDNLSAITLFRMMIQGILVDA